MGIANRNRIVPACRITFLTILGAGLAAVGSLANLVYIAPLDVSIDLRLMGTTGCLLGLILLLSMVVATWRFTANRIARGLISVTALLMLAIVIVSLVRLYGAYTIHEVRFANGDAGLSGTLLIPQGAGPHPAVVLVHGTDPSLRRPYLFYADFFARRGVAALVYDKRGHGHSSGDESIGGLNGLARDALAGYRLLQEHPRIDAGNCGFWGYSQGGAVAPLAASLAGDAAFVICLSGPGLTLGEQMIHCRNHQPSTQPAGELRDRIWQYYHDRQGYPELYADLLAAREEAWYPIMGMPPKLLTPEEAAATDELPFRWMGKYMNHDPIPVLESLDCPLLFFYGERDSIVPHHESIRRIEAALGDDGRYDYTINLYPGGGHSLVEWDVTDWPHYPVFVDGYLDDLNSWIHDKVVKQTGPSGIKPLRFD